MLMILYDGDTTSPRENNENFGSMVCWHRRYNLGDEHEHRDPNDFLQELVSETYGSEKIVDYIKSGAMENVKLDYDRSSKGWILSTFDNEHNKWYSEGFYEGSLKENTDILAIGIVETLANYQLMEMAKKQTVILPLMLYDHSGLSMSTTSFIGREVHAQWDSGQVGYTYATYKDIEKEYGSVTPETIEKANNLLVGEVKDYDCYLRGESYGFKYFENGEETNACWGFLGDIDNVKKSIAEHLPEESKSLVDDMEYIDETETNQYENDYEEEMEAV